MRHDITEFKGDDLFGVKGKPLHLSIKLLILITLLMGSLSTLVFFWSTHRHQEQMTSEMVAQAQGFALQMNAVWEFVDANQDRINYTSEGDYEFKGLHCSITGKAVGRLFTAQSDYTVRYVNFNPRNETDSPDQWETGALETFKTNPKAIEYYEMTSYAEKESLRYCAPLRIEAGCLDCHGSPAGEIDVTGYPKEGWVVGDLAGAISIVVPTESYIADYNTNARHDLIFYIAIASVALIIFYIAVYYLVSNPLRHIKGALTQVGQGELSIKMNESQSSQEIDAVINSFNTMTHELYSLYTTLEERVEDRTNALRALNEEVMRQHKIVENTNEKLKQETAYKSEFLAVMSHELRTPLTSVITYLEALQSPNSSLTDEDRRIVKQSEANSRELLLMINNILEVARSEDNRQKMNWETVDLFDVATFVLLEIEPLVQQKNMLVTKKFDPHTPLIYADWEKIQRIILNLLSNAIKYSEASSEVELTIRPQIDTLYPEKPSHVVIEVSDSGIGISPDKLTVVFERFTQADADARRQHNGSGLGLSIVKEFAQLHGGVVSATSELSIGSTFTVIIPTNEEKRSAHENNFAD